MLSLTCFNRRFTFDYRIIFIGLVIITILLNLGFWQIRRAEEKKLLLIAAKRLENTRALPWNPGNPLPIQYQSIRVRGRYLPQVLLLDNQYHNHQIGYDVLFPLELDDGKVILIDQGWIVAPSDRQQLPRINSAKTTPLTLKGSAYYPSPKSWVLGSAIEHHSAGITVIEKIESNLVGKVLHKSVYPFIIRLDEKEKGAFIRDWPIITMPPSRHYAYAAQWFALALVAFIAFLCLGSVDTSLLESKKG